MNGLENKYYEYFFFIAKQQQKMYYLTCACVRYGSEK